MGEFINKSNLTAKHFDTITAKAHKKLLSVAKTLRAYNFKFISNSLSNVIYFDTPENLLQRSGILFSKTLENGKHYFKIEKLSILPKAFRVMDEKVFVHEISQKDTPEEHSMYLVDAITTMFAQQFRVDLENVIRNVVPKMTIEIQSANYKVFSGVGFKCEMSLEKVIYKNFETKRKIKKDEVSFRHDGSKTFAKDYDEFIRIITKYCKDITEMGESQYDHAKNITKLITIENKEKFIKQKKEKKRKAEDIIEG